MRNGLLNDFDSSPVFTGVMNRAGRELRKVILWRKREMFAGFWCGNLKENNRLRELDTDGIY